CSKFSGVLFRPALDHNLLLGIKLHGVTTLSMHDIEETVFPTTEWKIRYGCGDINIYVNVSRRGFIAEAARGRTTRREQRRLVAECAALEERDRLIHIVGVNKAEHWTEDFGICELAGRWQIVEYRR